jgi:hypothetical protein
LIDGEAAAIAGVYAYSFDTNQTGSVTAAAGSARIDRLDVQVSDPAESDGSSNPGAAIVYTAGTPGSGVPQPAPSRSHPLALINVPASGGGSPTVSWNATYYAAPGAYVPFNTLAGLQAWTTAAIGQHATVISDPTPANNGDYAWNGTAWAPASPAVPVCRLTTTAAGSTAGSSTTNSRLPFNAETFDPYNMHDNVTNNSRITVPSGFSGYYRVTAKSQTASTSFASAVAIGVNGTVLPETVTYGAFTSASGSYPTVTTTVYLNGGDYVEAFTQATAANLSITSAGCFFEAEWVRA